MNETEKKKKRKRNRYTHTSRERMLEAEQWLLQMWNTLRLQNNTVVLTHNATKEFRFISSATVFICCVCPANESYISEQHNWLRHHKYTTDEFKWKRGGQKQTTSHTMRVHIVSSARLFTLELHLIGFIFSLRILWNTFRIAYKLTSERNEGEKKKHEPKQPRHSWIADSNKKALINISIYLYS